MSLTLTQKKWFAFAVVIISWGLLVWAITQSIELDHYPFSVGTISLAIYCCLAVFSSIYLGFLFCSVDFLDPVENPVWHCIFWSIAVLMIPCSIFSTILVAMLFIKCGHQLSKDAICFCWITAGIELAYSLAMIAYVFVRQIRESIRKHKEMQRDKKYKQGLEILNEQMDGGVYNRESFLEVYKDRAELEHSLERGEMVFLKKYYMKSCFTNLSSKTVQGETCCAICQNEWEETGTVFILPKCKHSFDQPCLEKWLEQSIRCPICKGSIRKGLTSDLQRLSESTEVSLAYIRNSPVQVHGRGISELSPMQSPRNLAQNGDCINPEQVHIQQA